MPNILSSDAGKICLRCEKPAEEHRPVWYLSGQREGFCTTCVFELIKILLVIEKVDKGELD